MEYQVLARKWRPQQLSDVVGQQHVTTTLANAIQKGRVAHAYIFTGPRGIGKTSTARILAKALNCAEGPTTTPCDRCASCEGIIAGNSIDVLEIDGASNRGIDQIRELRENVKFSPAASKYKIYIIDEVHQITPDAFNALLKTLEEPPSHVKFFFATTEPHKVPATILSRCQRFDMRSISPREIVERLTRIAEAEKITTGDEACFAIARYAQGSMRDAESILDQLVSFSDGSIGTEDVVSMLGLVRESVLQEMTEALISGDSRGGLKLIADVAEEGKELSIFLSDWISYLRSIMLILVLGDSEDVVDASPESRKVIAEQSGRISREQMLHVLDVLTRAEQQMRWSLSPRITIELAFMKAALAKDRTSVAEILEKISSLERRLAEGARSSRRDGQGGAASLGAAARERGRAEASRRAPGSAEEPAGKPAPAPPQSETKCPRSDKADRNETGSGSSGSPAHGVDEKQIAEQARNVWPEVLDRIAVIRPVLKSYLIEGEPSRFEDGVLFIRFDPRCSFHCQSAREARNKQLIMKVLSEKLGHDCAVRFEINSKDAPGEKETRRAAQKKDIQDLKRNPVIQSALEIFNAQVLEIKK